MTPVKAIYVYFFNQLATDLYKIGITNCITRRLREVQNGNPDPVVCHSFIEAENRFDARETEKELHRLLSASRRVGEWFMLDNGELDDIDRIWDVRRWSEK